MEIWLERFAGDLVRSPKRVQKLVERLIRETGCTPEQADKLRQAATKFSISEGEFAERKTLAKHVSTQVEQLDNFKDGMLEFVAKTQRDMLKKLIR